MRGYDRWERMPRRQAEYEWSRPPRETMGQDRYERMRFGRWDSPPLLDRGVYGEAYPGFGGYPGRPGGRPSRGRGWAGYGADYDAGYAREPFVPEAMYRRHPELERAPQRGGRWGYDVDGGEVEMEDEDILDAVRAKLYEDIWLDIDRIDVEVEDGVVTLSGEVGDFLEARYAWDDAWETDGVRGVVNHLTVRTDQPHHEHGDMVAQSSDGTRTEPGDGQGIGNRE